MYFFFTAKRRLIYMNNILLHSIIRKKCLDFHLTCKPGKNLKCDVDDIEE